ncbi:MAG: saccharopine dehydrogenase C-terminal domain-containing protein [Candidatus Krumholzibacteria bacterium]|nr:saccharopine dehydrogenase C-terminal domain-containing protein [Candidatus Krumholzibacteria bacterium]
MQKILVLGAGMVAGPLIRYLLDHNYGLTVTSLGLEDAVKLVGGDPHGTALSLDLSDDATLSQLVGEHDLVISLVPYSFHPLVANHCLQKGKNLITASYVSAEMAAFDQEAKEQGLIFLNEIGLDPGIDHMSAMRIIDDVHARGGKIRHFRSYCGGLPAPDANDNPYGYKFSWAPRGVLMASRNGARYWRDNHEVNVRPERLFRDMHLLDVPGAGVFEAYPNRDSLEYRDIYELGDEVRSVFRGTLRYIGWCNTMHSLVKIGMLDTEPRNSKDMTYADYMRDLLDAEPAEDLRVVAASRMRLPPDTLPPWNMHWLGLFSRRPIGRDQISPLDALSEIMQDKLRYNPGERDMVVLFHEFKAWFAEDDHYECLTSSLVDYGVRYGDSSMSRTVSLPAAIAARLILEGKITSRGVLRPVIPEIYNPVLDELANLNIVCAEEKTVY